MTLFESQLRTTMIINMEGQTKDNFITWFIQVHDCEVSSSNDSVESNIDDFFNK